MDLKNIKKVHFIGIGGIGMSALARIFLNQKKIVSGSDNEDSDLINDLKKEGIKVKIGHKESNLPKDAQLVVITEAIPENNEELKKAGILKIPILTYFQALGILSEDYFCIAICGSHGKTTSTAMMGLALTDAGLDPTVVIGSKVKEFGNKNVQIGKNKYLVVEACEYRRSFLHLKPNLILITNIEADHLDYYKDADDYRLAFEQLVKKLPGNSSLIVNDEDTEIKKILPLFPNLKIVKFGINKNSEKITSKFKLKVPGQHNILNALGVFSACSELGITSEKTINSLNKFQGTWRRFEYKGAKNGVEIYDDYGHHPTEIKATLKAAKEKFGNTKITVVYQPHQYNRTKMLFEGFTKAFNDANFVIIPNIYKVRDNEKDISDMSPEYLVEGIKKHNPNTIFGNGFENTVKILNQTLKKGDVLITMGAGDVFKVTEMFII